MFRNLGYAGVYFSQVASCCQRFALKLFNVKYSPGISEMLVLMHILPCLFLIRHEYLHRDVHIVAFLSK